MPKRWLSTVYLIFFILKNSISAQVEARLDSTQLETGNPMTLHLSVGGERPGAVDFSAWDSLILPVNRLKETDWRSENGRWTKTMTFTAFDSAQLELPPLDVQTSKGKTLKTNILKLKIYPTPVADNQLTEIKDIHRTQGMPLVWVLYFMLLALLLLFAISWWLRQRKQRKAVAVERKIELPAHELALRKLEALRLQQLWQRGELKTYYSEMTHIAREYLEKRYAVRALESTSDEILAELQRTDFPPELAPEFREVLQWADLAKFAKAEPPGSFHEMAMEKIIALVTRSAPPKVVENQAPILKNT